MTQIKNSILIVDDDSMIRQTLRILLRDAGFEVLGEASDGIKAMELLKKHKPGIVLLDINMPGSSGLDVLNDMHTEYPDIEVVMISGSASAEDVKTAVERGAAGYIVKPFNVKNVVQNIKRALQLQQRKKEKNMKKASNE